jgi:hypothetical protein
MICHKHFSNLTQRTVIENYGSNPFFKIDRMRTLILLIVMLPLLLAGCSKKPYQPKQFPQSVSGIVTFKDKPVADAEVDFSDTTRHIFVTAKTDAGGRFTVSPKDLPVGRYTVYLGPAGRADIPKQYQETPLVLSIEAGANDLPISIE